MQFHDAQVLSSFGFKFTSPDYIKTSKSWTFVDPRYGNPTIDINTWNTITSDNYITTIKNTRMSSNQDTKDTTQTGVLGGCVDVDASPAILLACCNSRCALRAERSTLRCHATI